MKKKTARPTKTTLKTESFKYAPNKVTEPRDEPVTTESTLPDDDDYNSGFGSYLRSSEGTFHFKRVVGLIVFTFYRFWNAKAVCSGKYCGYDFHFGLAKY